VLRGLLVSFLLLLLQACSDSTPVYHASEKPLRLSDWNLFQLSNERLAIHPDTLLFQPHNTLFSDYAHKLRTLWIPDGEQIRITDKRFDYPIGTILSKTFYYPISDEGQFLRVTDPGQLSELSLDRYRLIETRLLVRREDGWDAFPYVWNAEQTEAFLRVAGTSLPLTLHDGSPQDFTYFIPNENQCSGCHTRVHPDGGLEPLGAVVHQLGQKSPVSGGRTVLSDMLERQWLTELPAVDGIPSWQDESLPLSERANAYLDMNCGHCHNPDGPADTSALLLDGFSRSPREMGSCKPPVAAGGGAGDRLYGIVPGEPDASILVYRMQSLEPDEMMPELGRSLVHDEGVSLVRDWIAAMPGNCEQ
jgi:uncharacterized repeat protein (TIGR03806 family)